MLVDPVSEHRAVRGRAFEHAEPLVKRCDHLSVIWIGMIGSTAIARLTFIFNAQVNQIERFDECHFVIANGRAFTAVVRNR